MAKEEKTFWAIGEKSVHPHLQDWMKITAVASTKEMAESKRNMHFQGQIVARLTSGEADKILSSDDKTCLYTEFPSPVVTSVESIRQLVMNNTRRNIRSHVKNSAAFLELL
ncbi:MAG: hypothetical protein JRN62_03160 [Nitrososphaerota archaeon]|jgi:hypothetical protein|nr:hypothetical protein [Nitrososphaerota archaeon]MDG6948596.1 hypothetical protein [Nitrososphaerota archaeon]